MDGFTNAIRTAVVNQWRQNAAVGSAGACHFTKSNVTRIVGVVGDDEYEVVVVLGR